MYLFKHERYVGTRFAICFSYIFSSLATAQAYLALPSDASFITWNPAWSVDRDLEDMFANELTDNDILVLPERDTPYLIDSSEGFRASGVSAVTGRNGNLQN